MFDANANSVIFPILSAGKLFAAWRYCYFNEPQLSRWYTSCVWQNKVKFKMGKKDAQRAQMTPVDQYRKNIGKHDYKRNKKDVRKMKSEAEIRKSSTTLRVSAVHIITLWQTFYGVPEAICHSHSSMDCCHVCGRITPMTSQKLYQRNGKSPRTNWYLSQASNLSGEKMLVVQ